jgi:hypothetical protein
MNKSVFLTCQCHDPAHVIQIDSEDGEIMLHLQMNSHYNFFDRFKTAIKYLFNRDNHSWPWDCTILDEDQVNQLFILCQQARAARSKLHVQSQADVSDPQRPRNAEG